MKQIILKNAAASRIEYLIIRDLNGNPLTGLVFNSTGLVAYYARTAGSATAISLITQTITGAYSSGGFVEVSAANMPGLYRLDIPDACFATGADKVIVMLSGYAGMAQASLEYQLVDVNLQDGVRLGLTALPNAAAEASGGLFTRGTSAGQINQATAGMIDVNVVRMADVAQSLTDLKDFADTGYDPVTHKVAGVVLTDTVTTYTGNTPQTGDSFARIGLNGASLTALGDTRIANLDATVSSRSTYAGGAVASVTAAVTVGTNNDKTGYSLTVTPPTAVQIRTEIDSNSTQLIAIKAKTDSLNFTGTDVKATLDGETVVLTTPAPTATENADALLKRDMSAVTGEAARSPLNALRAIRNKATIAAGTLTVTKEDDATSAWTAAITTDAAAEPVTGVDPA